MEVRYTGPDASGVEVDLDGESVFCPRMEWVDLPTDTARSLAKQDVWELAGPVKAARTRKKNEAAEADEQPDPGEEG